MNYYRSILVTLACSFSCVVSALPSAAAEPVMFTVEEACARAVERAADSGTYAAVKEALVQRRAAVWTPDEPQARIEYTRNRLVANGLLQREELADAYQYTLRLYAPDLRTAGPERDAFLQDIRATEQLKRGAEQQVRMAVKQHWLEIENHRRSRELAEEYARLARRKKELLERQREEARATVMDVTRAGIDFVEASDAREGFAAGYSETRAALGVLLGLDNDAFELEHVWPVVTVDPRDMHVSALRELALQHRADLGAAAWRVGALEKRAEVAGRRKLPWFSHVQVSYEDEPGLPSDEAWAVQAALEVPLFQHLLSADAEIASAEVHRGQAELLDLRRVVVQDVERAYRQATASAERREAVRRMTGDIIAEIDAALCRADESGGFPAIDRNRLALERVELQQRVNELDYLYYEALLALEAAVGLPPSEWPVE